MEQHNKAQQEQLLGNTAREDHDMYHDRPFEVRRRMSDIPTDPLNPAYTRTIQAITEAGGQIPFSQFLDLTTPSPELETGEHTTPEPLILYGRTLGRQLMNTWEALGRPPHFRALEFINGEGSFQQAVMESLQESQEPATTQFVQALEYTSLDPREAANLEDNEVTGTVIAYRVVEKLPFERVTRIKGQLRQIMVTADSKGRFFEEWREPTPEVLDYIDRHKITIKEKVEEPITLAAEELQKNIHRSLNRGTALIIGTGEKKPVGVKDKKSYKYLTRIEDSNTGQRFVDDSSSEPSDTLLYQQIGQVAASTSVNFEPLVQAAEADQMSLIYNGLQTQFLWGAGITQEREAVGPHMKETTSLAEVMKLSRSYTASLPATEIGLEGGKHRVLFLGKGIELKLLPLKKHISTPGFPDYDFPLVVGNPGEKVTLSWKTGTTFSLPVDEKGVVSVRSLYLMGGDTSSKSLFKDRTVLKAENGEVLFDSQNPELAREVMEKSGYIWDI